MAVWDSLPYFRLDYQFAVHSPRQLSSDRSGLREATLCLSKTTNCN